MKTVSLYFMAALYLYAGIMHFIKPRFFLAIVPPYLPAHQALVALSGVAEVVLALGLLFPQTRPWAAWGIILLLLAVFPANVYMAYADKFQKMSPYFRWGRLPLQVVLIWWAWLFT